MKEENHKEKQIEEQYVMIRRGKIETIFAHSHSKATSVAYVKYYG